MPDAPYQPTERRPIASRQWPIWERTARALARRGVSANAISLAGMFCGVAAGACLALTGAAGAWSRLVWLAAGLCIQLRLLGNLLDGMVAIESQKASRLGELYNEVPDRVSDAATIIGAGYAAGGDPVAGYLATCAALFTAYVRAAGKASGAPHEYCGPMAKPHRMALLTAVALYCGLAPAALQPEWGDGRGLMAAGLWVMTVGGLLTAVRRLVRIATFLKGASA